MRFCERPLTDRERQCLSCAAHGLTAKGAAQALGISEGSARGYLKLARLKLHAASTTEAVRIAMQRKEIR